MVSGSAQAVTSRVGTAEDVGVGIQLGQPMGVTGKYWLSSTSAVDAAAGYHFNSNFDMHGDYPGIPFPVSTSRMGVCLFISASAGA